MPRTPLAIDFSRNADIANIGIDPDALGRVAIDCRSLDSAQMVLGVLREKAPASMAFLGRHGDEMTVYSVSDGAFDGLAEAELITPDQATAGHAAWRNIPG